MLTSEAKAKTKWCPMVRSRVNDGAGNCTAIIRTPDNCNCVASQCAMWRWYTPDYTKGPFFPPDDDYGADRYGYCGLAGIPVVQV